MNLNPFQNKSPDKQLAAAIADCKKRVAERDEAEQQVIAKRTARDELADAGRTGDELHNAVDAHLKAQAYVQTLDLALEKKRELVRDLQAEVDDNVDKALRADNSVIWNKLADDIADSHVAVETVLKRHASLHALAAQPMPEARGVEIFSTSAVTELQPADDLIIKGLRSHAAAVLSGAAPAVLPVPALKPLPAPQPAPMKSVLSTRPVKWRDTAGIHSESKWKELSLPAAIADRAVANGHAVPPGHELWKQKGFGPIYSPKLSDCINLDDPDAPAAPVKDNVQSLQPKDIHSAFERPTIGPKVEFKMPRAEPSLANATRNLPSEDKDNKT
jgi:hypothetical protein